MLFVFFVCVLRASTIGERGSWLVAPYSDLDGRTWQGAATRVPLAWPNRGGPIAAATGRD